MSLIPTPSPDLSMLFSFLSARNIESLREGLGTRLNKHHLEVEEVACSLIIVTHNFLQQLILLYYNAMHAHRSKDSYQTLHSVLAMGMIDLESVSINLSMSLDYGSRCSPTCMSPNAPQTRVLRVPLTQLCGYYNFSLSLDHAWQLDIPLAHP